MLRDCYTKFIQKFEDIYMRQAQPIIHYQNGQANPPCPGKIWPESFIWIVLFNNDSHKSPKVELMEIVRLNPSH